MHLESLDQIITLSLPDSPLVSTFAPIKSLDHGSTLGVDNKQTALFFFLLGFIGSVKGICVALQWLCSLATLNKAVMLYILALLQEFGSPFRILFKEVEHSPVLHW